MEASTVKNGILATVAAFGSFIANQLGGWDAALLVLICVMAADYITGILRAAVFHDSPKTETGKLSSNASFKGLVRKFIILLLVWLGALLDKVIGAAYIRTAIAMFFIANEALSILENTAAMGVPYPKFIKSMLEAMREDSENAK